MAPPTFRAGPDPALRLGRDCPPSRDSLSPWPSRRSGVAYAEYVAFDEAAERKNEYVRGAIFAMTGGTPEHARLPARSRRAARRGPARGCVVYSSDYASASGPPIGPRIPSTVICGPPETSPIDGHAAINPRSSSRCSRSPPALYDQRQVVRLPASRSATTCLVSGSTRVEVYSPNRPRLPTPTCRNGDGRVDMPRRLVRDRGAVRTLIVRGPRVWRVLFLARPRLLPRSCLAFARDFHDLRCVRLHPLCPSWRTRSARSRRSRR